MYLTGSVASEIFGYIQTNKHPVTGRGHWTLKLHWNPIVMVSSSYSLNFNENFGYLFEFDWFKTCSFQTFKPIVSTFEGVVLFIIIWDVNQFGLHPKISLNFTFL